MKKGERKKKDQLKCNAISIQVFQVLEIQSYINNTCTVTETEQKREWD